MMQGNEIEFFIYNFLKKSALLVNPFSEISAEDFKMTRENGVRNLFFDLIGYLVGSTGGLKQRSFSHGLVL